jgi:glycosyltransferase involved in cell wall biosynthesis
MGNCIIPPEAGWGRHNLFVLQFPFPIAPRAVEDGKRLWNQYERIVVYSDYVKRNVEKVMKRHALPEHKIDIAPPPIDLSQSSVTPKRAGCIVNVGRFFEGGHCKRQDLLIEAFRGIVRENSDLSLELHLVGSLHPEPEHREYLQRCKRLAEGTPVFFHLDAGAGELEELYRRSSLYWHAAGLGANLCAHPEKAEHFGISVVEAMSAGCIPIVFGRGGPAEVVENGFSGYHYRDIAELQAITIQLIRQSDQSSIEVLRMEARRRASCYNTHLFRKRWQTLIGNSLCAN